MRINYVLLTFIGVAFLWANVCLGSNLDLPQASGASGNSNSGGKNEKKKKSGGFLGRLKKLFGGKHKPEEPEELDSSFGDIPKHHYDQSTEKSLSSKIDLDSEGVDYDGEYKSEDFDGSKSDRPLGPFGVSEDSVSGEYPQAQVESDRYDADSSAPTPKLPLGDYKEETTDLSDMGRYKSEEFPVPSDIDSEQAEESQKIPLVGDKTREMIESGVDDSTRPLAQDLLSIYDEKSEIPPRGVRIYQEDTEKEGSEGGSGFSSEIPLLNGYLISEGGKSEKSEVSMPEEKAEKSLPSIKSTKYDSEASKEDNSERPTKESEEHVSEESPENLPHLTEKSSHISEKTSSQLENSKQKNNHYESSYDNMIEELENSVSEYIKRNEESFSELPHETYDRLIKEAMEGGELAGSFDNSASKESEDISKPERKYNELSKTEKSDGLYEGGINLDDHGEKYPTVAQNKENEDEISEEDTVSDQSYSTGGSKKVFEDIKEVNTENVDDESEKLSEMSEKLQESEITEKMGERSNKGIPTSDNSSSKFKKIKTTFDSLFGQRKRDVDESKSFFGNENGEKTGEGFINNLLENEIKSEQETGDEENIGSEDRIGNEGNYEDMKGISEDKTSDVHQDANGNRVKMLIERFENENRVNKPSLITSPRNKLGFRDTEKSSPEKRSIDNLINFFELESIKNKEVMGTPLPKKNTNNYPKEVESADISEQKQEQTLVENSDGDNNQLKGGHFDSKEYNIGDISSETTKHLGSDEINDSDMEDIASNSFDAKSYSTEQSSNIDSEVSEKSPSLSSEGINRRLFNLYSILDGIEYSALPFPGRTFNDMAGGIEWALSLGKAVCEKSKVLFNPMLYPTLDGGIIKSPTKDERRKLMQSIDDMITDDILDIVSNNAS
ncbi:signal peptide containing [Cryptosporidium bovis]|uniref:signal peptide containing n=1 Tax=Cryptosporidium bovis TaxID=310047 RepID=UPI003519E2A8|nr:signal peptide containing [Cryptosporidium bovis]